MLDVIAKGLHDSVPEPRIVFRGFQVLDRVDSEYRSGIVLKLVEVEPGCR